MGAFKNPGVLELAALKAVYEFRGNRIDVVIPAPDHYSAALGSLIAAYLKAGLCIPSRLFTLKNSIVEAYTLPPSTVEVAAIPRSCVPRKSKVLITAATTRIPSLIEASLGLALKSRAEVRGVFSLEGSRNTIQAILAEKAYSDAKIIVLINAAE